MPTTAISMIIRRVLTDVLVPITIYATSSAQLGRDTADSYSSRRFWLPPRFKNFAGKCTCKGGFLFFAGFVKSRRDFPDFRNVSHFMRYGDRAHCDEASCKSSCRHLFFIMQSSFGRLKGTLGLQRAVLARASVRNVNCTLSRFSSYTHSNHGLCVLFCLFATFLLFYPVGGNHHHNHMPSKPILGKGEEPVQYSSAGTTKLLGFQRLSFSLLTSGSLLFFSMWPIASI